MKKYILILIILATFNISYSQNVKIGLYADPQISWLKPDIPDVENTGTKFGVNIGLEINNYFAENYAFATGISINNVGGELTFADEKPLRLRDQIDTLSAGSALTYKIQYLNLPLGLKLKTNEIGYITFFANVGMNCQLKLKAIGDVNSTNIKDDNINEEINLFNLAYHIGGGFEYSIGGNSAVSVGIIFYNGILDVTNNDYLEDIVNSKTMALRIGLKF